MNPCPCGYLTDPRRACRCTPPQIERYMAKVSGPLLDRIDIHVEVPGVPFHELAGDTPGTDSREMAEQVEVAIRAFEAVVPTADLAGRTVDLPSPVEWGADTTTEQLGVPRDAGPLTRDPDPEADPGSTIA